MLPQTAQDLTPQTDVVALQDITLSDDQDRAYKAFAKLVRNPAERVLVIKGPAGTGKTTLTSYLIDAFPRLLRTAKLITQKTDDKKDEWELVLTATTNKAAEAMQSITGKPVSTIQSFLGLRVQRDIQTGATKLVPSRKSSTHYNKVIVVDEASFLDREVLGYIFEQLGNCKLLLIGDPYQLLSIKAKDAPAFKGNFPMVELGKVLRQAEGNPIIELATRFRETVRTGNFFSFTPDNDRIRVVGPDEFEREVMAEFDRPDWTYSQSKLLAWTNARVISYNQEIRAQISGEPQLQVGDYAINNSYVPAPKGGIKTDQLVRITGMTPGVDNQVQGHWVMIDLKDEDREFFLPESLQARKKAIKHFRTLEDHGALRQIESKWIDLRAAYACTVNKSQGSTFKRVFIDLDDISKCRNPNQMARMLYVAISRASDQVIFTGDLV